PSRSSIWLGTRPVMSTKLVGECRPSFTSRRSVWPPASRNAPCSAPSRRASASEAGRWYAKSRMIGLRLGGHRRSTWGNGIDNVVIARAAADIALKLLPDCRLIRLTQTAHDVERYHHHA